MVCRSENKNLMQGQGFTIADGSVHFLRYAADAVLPALSTRARGEVVGNID